ncbi:MAG: hypothetical protein WBD78_02120 [Methylocella sp.]
MTPMVDLGARRPFPAATGCQWLAMRIDGAKAAAAQNGGSAAISALLQAKSMELLGSVEDLIRDFEQGLYDD